MITVLTPTYNRADLLCRLAESLCAQKDKDFEWLVIDDGSSDNTSTVIEHYKDICDFPVHYIYKKNEGKHSALNLGFRHARQDWIFIVDSDDWIRDDCIEKIKSSLKDVDSNVAALSLLKGYPNGKVIGDSFSSDLGTYIDRIECGIKGDKADVLNKKALRAFQFPVFVGEKFMPESPLFIFLGKNYKTKFVNYLGYVCEYQSGGLSEQSILNRHKCYNSTLYVYETQYKALNSSLLRQKAAINWWRFRVGKAFVTQKKSPNKYFLPVGAVLFVVDFILLGPKIINTHKVM
ncbi:glycosyltransferase family 2 protein [Salinivibrio kushneri]|uniref:glycosyltransferase family 2 protein n=1 Tax=Salinivibrio kushneri TaxID=1908198 RepID=UPI0009D34886|nr:glycosyltransferase family A protein [Salinivibrio kushneri]OOE63845.1 hypothetical protein BZG19_15690 [Salinivibrio kushneri]